MTGSWLLCRSARAAERARRRQRGRLKDRRGGITGAKQDLANCAGRLIHAVSAAMVGGGADTRAKGQRPVGLADDIGKGDIPRRAAEQVAALPSAETPDDAPTFEVEKNLLEEFPGNFRLLSDLGNHHRLFARVLRQNQ